MKNKIIPLFDGFCAYRNECVRFNKPCCNAKPKYNNKYVVCGKFRRKNGSY